jgi:hypothetical protein
MSKPNTLSSTQVIQLHDTALSLPNWPSEAALRHKDSESVLKLVEINHFYNTQLWDEEDLARRQKVSDSEIAKNKRAIDKFNQARNDFIEKIDDFILEHHRSIANFQNAKQNSETMGAIIDRLSILSLKIFHMTIQTNRTDASNDHIQNCTQKLNILKIQRNDLGSCLDDLVKDYKEGLRYFKQYKQFKMYNDPNLNPQIYKEQ